MLTLTRFPSRLPCSRTLARTLAAATVALIVSSVATVVTAKDAPRYPAVKIISGNVHAEPSFVRDGMRISAATGAPLAIYGPSAVVDAADPTSMARQYLGEHRQLLQLRNADLSDLIHRFTRESAIGVTVRFDQYFHGVRVEGGEIAVSIDQQNRVVFVANGYKPTVELTETVPTVSTVAARQTAIDHLDPTGGFNHDETSLVVHRTDSGWRLAHRVQLVPRVSPSGDWEIMVDARTGEILRAVDRAHYVDGTGEVFDPDPLSSAGVSYGDPGFTDDDDANTPELDAARVNVVLPDIDFNAGVYTLKGPYAEIRDFEEPFYGLFTETSPTWNYNRFDNAFEAALTYYHIDQIMRWLNVDLGLSIMPTQYSGGVRFDPHGLNGADNSYYSGFTGQIAFGEGGVDDSEDADVVIHELGHGLHDWVTGGSLSQVDGLSEGTGDYIAASYNRSLGQWTPADPQYFWVFDWDGHNPFWPGRVTNHGASYPGGLVGQIHTDGQIWSTCLMRIWNEIGRAQTDRACFAGLGMTHSSSSQDDAANAVLQAATAFGYSPSELSAIVANFQQTGYTVGTPAEIELSPTSFSVVLPPGNVTVEELTIQNLADPQLGAILDWSIADFLDAPFTGGTPMVIAGRPPATLPPLELAKDQPDPRSGSGPGTDFDGPDAFGYLWIDSDDPAGPVFSWQDITGVGTSLTLADDGSIDVPLPFPFEFYGLTKTSVRINANGFLTFGVGGIVWQNTGIPDASPPNDLVAGFWDDLDPTLGGTVHHHYDAGQGEFIVQYTSIQHFGGGSPYTFQIILQDDGEILYQYLSMLGGLDSATIGIEDAAGSTGLQVVANAAYVHDDLAVLFTRVSDCPWLSVSPTSGSLSPQGSQVADVTVDATGMTPGDYDCDLFVSSNDPDEATIVVPVALQVSEPNGIAEQAASPGSFRLHGNRPNPFNPMTTIRYELPLAGSVRLAIYDEAGRLVRVLVDAVRQDAGTFSEQWDGRDGAGAAVASGVYFYQLDAVPFRSTRRAVLIR